MKSDPEVFLSNAFEYYAAAKFAVYAQRAGVCGNITHNAVEMFLKGDSRVIERSPSCGLWAITSKKSGEHSKQISPILCYADTIGRSHSLIASRNCATQAMTGRQ